MVAIANPLNDCLCEWIIHNRIKRTTIKPLICTLPDFSHDVCIGIHRFHKRPPLKPEWHRHFIWNIKSPSINSIRRITVAIWIHPSACHIEDVLLDFVTGKSLIILAKDWQFQEACPSVIFKWFPRSNAEPIFVCAASMLRLHIAKCRMRRADMIEDAIKNDTNSKLFRLFEHLKKEQIGWSPCPCLGVEKIFDRFGFGIIALCSKRFIDMHKICRVIFVMGWRLKDRI